VKTLTVPPDTAHRLVEESPIGMSALGSRGWNRHAWFPAAPGLVDPFVGCVISIDIRVGSTRPIGRNLNLMNIPSADAHSCAPRPPLEEQAEIKGQLLGCDRNILARKALSRDWAHQICGAQAQSIATS